MKQLDLFYNKEDNPLLKEDHVDLSKIAIFFGESGQRQKDLNRTSEKIQKMGENEFIIYKTGSEHPLKERYEGRNDFPFIYSNKTGNIIQPQFSRTVYPSYALRSTNGVEIHILAHRVYAMAFIKNHLPCDTIYVDHINEDKLDFSISNLRWVTAKYNSTRAHSSNNSAKNIGRGRKILGASTEF